MWKHFVHIATVREVVVWVQIPIRVEVHPLKEKDWITTGHLIDIILLEYDEIVKDIQQEKPLQTCLTDPQNRINDANCLWWLEAKKTVVHDPPQHLCSSTMRL